MADINLKNPLFRSERPWWYLIAKKDLKRWPNYKGHSMIAHHCPQATADTEHGSLYYGILTFGESALTSIGCTYCKEPLPEDVKCLFMMHNFAEIQEKTLKVN
jgi:hypothetical protein